MFGNCLPPSKICELRLKNWLLENNNTTTQTPPQSIFSIKLSISHSLTLIIIIEHLSGRSCIKSSEYRGCISLACQSLNRTSLRKHFACKNTFSCVWWNFFFSLVCLEYIFFSWICVGKCFWLDLIKKIKCAMYKFVLCMKLFYFNFHSS